MRLGRLTKYWLRFSGAMWLLIGLAHAFGVLRLKELLSQQSTLQESQKDQILINWGISGIAISVLGLILLLSSSESLKQSKPVFLISAIIGVFFFLAGLAAFLIVPNLTVLIVFSCPALLVMAALFVSRKQHSAV